MAEEKRFENRVKKFLREQGCYYVKYWGGGTYTKSGVPDLLVSVNGYFLGIELKATNGKPSPLQLYHLGAVRRSGGTGILLYPRDWEKFTDFIISIVSYGYSPQTLLRSGDYPFLKRWWSYDL